MKDRNATTPGCWLRGKTQQPIYRIHTHTLLYMPQTETPDMSVLLQTCIEYNSRYIHTNTHTVERRVSSTLLQYIHPSIHPRIHHYLLLRVYRVNCTPGPRPVKAEAQARCALSPPPIQFYSIWRPITQPWDLLFTGRLGGQWCGDRASE